MSSEQKPSLKLPPQSDRNARFMQLSRKAKNGQPLYRFLVQCSNQEESEFQLIIEVRVETPSLEVVGRAIAEAVGKSWKCEQVWLPVQDWLSTGALMGQAS